MKSLVQFINESKEKPMYEEWEIHSYVDYMLNEWFKNNQNYVSILSATDVYSKRELVKNCERNSNRSNVENCERNSNRSYVKNCDKTRNWEKEFKEKWKYKRLY